MTAVEDRMIERVTNWIAGGAIATWAVPDFYSWSIAVSHGAAMLAPVLGCCWLGVQITRAVYHWNKGKTE
jgi:hypothetical protein